MTEKHIKMTDFLIDHLYTQNGISSSDEYPDYLEKLGYDSYREVPHLVNLLVEQKINKMGRE
jgi:hypothetical protein